MPDKLMKSVFLALGTNLGDRVANLDTALAHLPPSVRVLNQSPIYETLPWGVTDQPLFLNMVIRAETALAPRRLLKKLKHLEKRMGRVDSLRNGPRVIDLDILFYDDLVIQEPGLTIPHPRLHERGFVLVPLNDVAPGFVHPVLKKTVNSLLKTVDVTGVKRYAG